MQVCSLARIIYTDIRQSGHRPATSSGYWIGTRTTPIPIFRRSRSGYLRRAFSASSLVLNGFDKMTSSRPLYSNSSHRTEVFTYFKSLQNAMFAPFVSCFCLPSGDSIVYGPGGPAQHACAVLVSNITYVAIAVVPMCENGWRCSHQNQSHVHAAASRQT